MPAAKRKKRVNTGAGLTDEQIKEANSKANKLSATARKLVASSNTDLSSTRLRSGRILSDGSKEGKKGANKLRAAKRGKITTTTTGKGKKVTGKKTTSKKVTGKKVQFKSGRRDPNRLTISDAGGKKAREAYAATAQAAKKKLGENKKFTRSQSKEIKSKLQKNPARIGGKTATTTKLVGNPKTGTYRAVKQSLDQLTGLVKGLMILKREEGFKTRLQGVNTNTVMRQKKPKEGKIRSETREVPMNSRNQKLINTISDPSTKSSILNQTFNSLLDNYQLKYKMRYDKNGKLISGSGKPANSNIDTSQNQTGINIQSPAEARFDKETKERQRQHAQG